MQVTDFLKTPGNSLTLLTLSTGIKVKEYPEEGLYVLNYDQIDSPKTHPLVMECRALILDREFNVVARAFDRFFNLNEAPDTQAHLDWDIAEIADKVDGSLIKLYYWNDAWHFSTRGTAFAESQCMNSEYTFHDLCVKASNASYMEEVEASAELADLDQGVTYLLELTCRENRVVTVYEGYDLHFLGARRNDTGEYVSVPNSALWVMNWKAVNKYKFDSAQACKETAEKLPNLAEGYVVYQNGIPVCKVKSPAYVAVHHLRGNGIPSLKRIVDLVAVGEEDEYLTYFPEDRKYFDPVTQAKAWIINQADAMWHVAKDIEEQKQFAIVVKDLSFAWLLFQARKVNKEPSEVFNSAPLEKRSKTILNYVEKAGNALN